jgi:DNA-binding NtrC family response regulator
VADASAEPSSVAWQPLHPDAAIYMGVAAPDDAARWAAVRRRLTSWYAVARLAFAQALSDTPPAPSSAAASPAATAPSGPQVVAESSAMAAVDQRIRGIRSSHSPVLIQGERGAGKSFVARAVHAASERSGGPFLTLDCSSMQQDPLERRLFGRSEGATASPSSAAAADPADEPGALRRGRDGTLVLEAVDALPRQLQARLRHVLATGTFFPLGAEEPATTTARVVATSSRNLRDAVHAGDFDAQLYHHLNVIALRVPPLRERTDDIPLLVRRFLDDLCPGGAPMASITHDALEALLRYPWPGNVRQLRNEIEQALSAVRSEPAPTIGLDELSEAVRATVHTEPAAASPSSGPGGDGSVAEASASDAPAIHQSDQTLRSILADTERSVIEQALAACDGQVTASADMLGLSRQGLYKKMDRLGIDATAFQPHASPS